MDYLKHELAYRLLTDYSENNSRIGPVLLQADYVSTLPGKTKNSTKQPTAYCSAFC